MTASIFTLLILVMLGFSNGTCITFMRKAGLLCLTLRKLFVILGALMGCWCLINGSCAWWPHLGTPKVECSGDKNLEGYGGTQ
jgi:hypothetical protein